MRRRLRKTFADWDAYWHKQVYANLKAGWDQSQDNNVDPDEFWSNFHNAVISWPKRINLEWPRDNTLISSLRYHIPAKETA